MYYNQDRSLQAIGQKLYIENMRPEIAGLLKLAPALEMQEDDKKTKTKGKGGGKKKSSGMSAEEIIQNKIAEDIVKYLPNVIRASKDVPKAREHLSELRMVQIMFYCDYVLNLLVKDPNTHLGYEAVLALHNAIRSGKLVKNMAPQVMIDAQEIMGRLDKHVRFSYEELLTVYPRLVFGNLYSELYHEAVIKPYLDQQRIIDSLATKCSLIFYNTVPGSGKTTAVVGVVCKIMREAAPKQAPIEQSSNEKKELNMGRGRHKERKRNIAKKSQKGQGNRIVVFVCTNMLVREQVFLFFLFAFLCHALGVVTKERSKLTRQSERCAFSP